ncbi:hypothetical protein [Dyadobacter koreensis]|uniref:hypothetical protein n=1 Tax=Dyadobacter koreensis TaxID=408657 RepID=UPI001C432F87|nr:hypothetical protein [Dyadobacter koreensis]
MIFSLLSIFSKNFEGAISLIKRLLLIKFLHPKSNLLGKCILIVSHELWLQNAMKPNLDLKGFARGIESDYEVVNQAVISNVNGPVVGQVNKLKTIKRNIYGRASFDLLKIMVLGNTS